MTCKSRDPRFIAKMVTVMVALIVTAMSAAPGRARAQAEDQATARALFAEGRRLMKAGKYADACPKLEAAQKLYSSAGILLNLGDCYEKVGKTASAWTRFGEAVSVASRTNRTEDADEAHRRQEALEPALVRLVILVPVPVAGLVVTRDGITLDEATWGVTLPVDPGEHAIRAEASGYEPWSAPVTLSRRGETVTVKVPKLNALAAPALVEKPPLERITEPKETAHPSTGGGHGLAWTLLIGGAVVGAGGGALMLVESQRAQTAINAKNQPAYDATVTPWFAGLAGAIVGGLAAAGGVVLFAVGSRSSSSDSEPSGATASAWVSPGPGGIQISGFW